MIKIKIQQKTENKLKKSHSKWPNSRPALHFNLNMRIYTWFSSVLHSLGYVNAAGIVLLAAWNDAETRSPSASFSVAPVSHTQMVGLLMLHHRQVLCRAKCDEKCAGGTRGPTQTGCGADLFSLLLFGSAASSSCRSSFSKVHLAYWQTDTRRQAESMLGDDRHVSLYRAVSFIFL